MGSNPILPTIIERRHNMASQNKKNKAKNSFIYNGAEAQKDIKRKRIWYFTKADRVKTKLISKDEF